LTLLSAPGLFSLAKDAYARTAECSSDNSPNAKDAIVAVVLSVAALEGFINEFIGVATMPEEPLWEGESIREVVPILEELERAEGSTKLKFMLVKKVITGKPYERGKPPLPGL
jgi:hypothetical protein